MRSLPFLDAFRAIAIGAIPLMVPGFLAGDERKDPLWLQAPIIEGTGGTLAVAEPIKPTGGWRSVYRGADDFTFEEEATIGSVAWWGC